MRNKLPDFSTLPPKKRDAAEKKLTQCLEAHPVGINYSTTDFTRSTRDELQFICGKHGPFRRSFSLFLRTERPCPKCLEDGRLAKRKHGLLKRFDYTKTNFEIPEREVNTVTCKIHGDIRISLYDHKRYKTGGCPECNSDHASASQRMSVSEFIRRAKLIHGDLTYEYSKVIPFRNQHELVTVGCKVRGHGLFQQSPANHLHKTRPQGCPLCGISKGADKRSLTLERFLEKANLVHGDTYDYSKVAFKRSKDRIAITCKTCSSTFEQTINDHLSGYGCSTCGAERSRLAKQTVDTALAVQRCKEAWGDKYDYSQTVYVDDDTPIKVICPKHGELWMDYQNHVGLKRGCKFCGSTRRQKQNDWLDSLGVPDNGESREVTIKFNDGTRCYADGFDVQTKTVYEFNGDYFHGNPKVYPPDLLNRFSGRTMREELERTRLKKKKLQKSGYTVIDIWESDWDQMVILP